MGAGKHRWNVAEIDQIWGRGWHVYKDGCPVGETWQGSGFKDNIGAEGAPHLSGGVPGGEPGGAGTMRYLPSQKQRATSLSQMPTKKGYMQE